ncbi:hypothetical protein [Poseidonocella sedimentorum]|uniref:DUF5666 domain-containing protein n=1 Tax=Poseidonocella sedimentorum TaxID=871652 RepID=A0A1I6DHZ3_9RHOB|nr:hypothetical protein [Poseidonocella sedimentorum]SFR04952.1 hypothetical protein SAMN04515673_103275 [Poseidonocella sedimentorum]
MSPKAKPYSLGRTIAVGLAIAASFAILSLFFLYLQARGNLQRLAGEVVAVSQVGVSVQNARGDITAVTVPLDAELHGMASFRELEPGQHVMIRGRILDDGTFEVDRMRTLTEGPVR